MSMKSQNHCVVEEGSWRHRLQLFPAELQPHPRSPRVGRRHSRTLELPANEQNYSKPSICVLLG